MLHLTETEESKPALTLANSKAGWEPWFWAIRTCLALSSRFMAAVVPDHSCSYFIQFIVPQEAEGDMQLDWSY